MTSVLTVELWETLTTLARKAKHRHIAVAYVGHGASKLLPLRKGDTLIVDMSMPTVRNGQTDPREIELYLNKGVRVYTCSNLHAKIYLFDNTLIIGSPNLSRHSRNTLVEAGLLSQDRTSVVEARGFIRDLQSELVTPGYISICKRLYKPPKFDARVNHRSSPKPIPVHSLLWLAGVQDLVFDNREDQMCEIAESRLSSRLRDPRSFEIGHLRWTDVGLGALGRRGDLVVQVWRKRRSIQVYPPARILGVTQYKKAYGHPVIFHLEETKRPRTLSFSKFRGAVAKVGLKRISPQSDRLIKSPEQRRTILGLWS